MTLGTGRFTTERYRAAGRANPFLHKRGTNARSAEGAAHLARTEPALQYLDAVHHDDRDALAVEVGKSGVVDVDDLERVAPATGTALHERERIPAQAADASGHEPDVAHRRSCIVGPLMRPFTVLTIGLLLLALSVAGIVFVMQLLATT